MHTDRSIIKAPQTVCRMGRTPWRFWHTIVIPELWGRRGGGHSLYIMQISGITILQFKSIIESKWLWFLLSISFFSVEKYLWVILLGTYIKYHNFLPFCIFVCDNWIFWDVFYYCDVIVMSLCKQIEHPHVI